jgi:hypothetical protein
MAAGAAGTAVLNATSYADMAIRGRPASELPDKMVTALAKRAGLPAPEGPRQTAIGALLGYADGFGAGAVYGLLRPAMRRVPWFLAGIGLAALTLVLSEGTATAMGQTNPREWGFEGWMEDIVPRCLYGCVTALTYERLTADYTDW